MQEPRCGVSHLTWLDPPCPTVRTRGTVISLRFGNDRPTELEQMDEETRQVWERSGSLPPGLPGRDQGGAGVPAWTGDGGAHSIVR